MPLAENFIANFTAACQAARLSYAEVARRASVEPSTISRILHGRLSPSLEMCEALARAANMRPDIAFLTPEEPARKHKRA